MTDGKDTDTRLAHTAENARNTVVDRRVRKTRNALTDALIRLMAEKPFKSITVKELTDVADVNRATFYVHYKDIYDMLDQTKQDVRDNASNAIESHKDELEKGEYLGFTHDLFAYFAEHDALFALLLGENGDAAFLESTMRILSERFFSLDTFSGCQEGSPASRRAAGTYQFVYVCGGLGTMIKYWLSNKDNRESVDTMAKIAAEFMRNANLDIYARNIRILEEQGA